MAQTKTATLSKAAVIGSLDSSEGPPRMIPDPDGQSAEFYRRLATGRLHVQGCDACGRSLHPPRYLCPGCGSDSLRFRPAEGHGRIFSWTVTHRAVDPGWEAQIPYATVVVEMQEGVRFVGGWRGTNDELSIGLPVRAEIEPVSEQFAFLWFRRVSTTA